MPLKKKHFCKSSAYCHDRLQRIAFSQETSQQRVINLEINGCNPFLRINFAFFRIKDVIKCRRCFPGFFEAFFQPPCQDREDVEEGSAVQAVQIVHHQASQLFALGCDVHGCCLLVLTTKENQREKRKKIVIKIYIQRRHSHKHSPTPLYITQPLSVLFFHLVDTGKCQMEQSWIFVKTTCRI